MRTIKCISLHQRVALAYLSGCLHGDACMGKTFALRVKDRDFAEAFALAIAAAFGEILTPRLERGRYWNARIGCNDGRFDEVRNFVPETPWEKTRWLRGLFDSEGNAQLTPIKKWPGSFARRVAFYSTATDTLGKASEYLNEFDCPAILRERKATAGHLGSKTVYELQLRESRERYATFASAIGSSIGRKQATLNAIVLSYPPDRAESYRRAQAKGVITRLARTESKLPAILDVIREKLDMGESPRPKHIAGMPGYWALKRRYPFERMVELAKEPRE